MVKIIFVLMFSAFVFGCDSEDSGEVITEEDELNEKIALCHSLGGIARVVQVSDLETGLTVFDVICEGVDDV